MRTYRVTGTYDFSEIVDKSDNFELVVEVEDGYEVEDVVDELLCDDVEELYGFNIQSCVDITPVPAPALVTPGRERLMITRTDGTTYTCYATYQDVVAVTQPVATGVQGTRVTDPITLRNGTIYRPVGTVEHA